jgi:hypothetical protein
LNQLPLLLNLLLALSLSAEVAALPPGLRAVFTLAGTERGVLLLLLHVEDGGAGSSRALEACRKQLGGRKTPAGGQLQ